MSEKDKEKIYGNYYDAFLKEEKSQTEKIMQDRDKIKNTLSKQLTSIGFTNLEIAEVLDIITITEANIQILKDSLIGTNINTYDPTPVMKKTLDEIRDLNIKMGEEIKRKINEIKIRKEEHKRALDSNEFDG